MHKHDDEQCMRYACDAHARMRSCPMTARKKLRMPCSKPFDLLHRCKCGFLSHRVETVIGHVGRTTRGDVRHDARTIVHGRPHGWLGQRLGRHSRTSTACA